MGIRLYWFRLNEFDIKIHRRSGIHLRPKGASEKWPSTKKNRRSGDLPDTYAYPAPSNSYINNCVSFLFHEFNQFISYNLFFNNIFKKFKSHPFYLSVISIQILCKLAEIIYKLWP